MGEAKRRAASYPNFGKAKPPKLGLVVSPPIEIQGTSLHIRMRFLDPQELRFSILLWDNLVWPLSRVIHLSGGPDEAFLESAGILTRPEYTFSGDVAQGMARTHIQAFMDLDVREPGRWALAQGENSLLLKDLLLEPDTGALLELTRAIPVPDKDVPLNDVLEFKQRRVDELRRLRSELDTFVAAVSQAEDKEAELRAHIATVDAACADALRVSREWQFPVRLTNFKASVELRPIVTAVAGVSIFGLSTISGLAASAAVLAGIGGAVAATAPALKLGADFGWRGLKRRLGPYRYVYQFHNELF